MRSASKIFEDYPASPQVLSQLHAITTHSFSTLIYLSSQLGVDSLHFLYFIHNKLYFFIHIKIKVSVCHPIPIEQQLMHYFISILLLLTGIYYKYLQLLK